MKKRVISFLMVLVLLAGLVPVAVQAETVDTAVTNGGIDVQATNGLGALLMEDIRQEGDALTEQAEAGYTLTSLTVTEGTATVIYDSLEEATVVVALYTEDGSQLLVSGKTTVSPEETKVTVELEGDLPDYFLAAAYLLDCYDLSPLCPRYETKIYTREMQELLASTVEDYPEDRVLQLADTPDTNFLVYAEHTKVIAGSESTNLVASADEQTNTYIIENADESITSLQKGDVFVYPYSEEEILIVKVDTVTLEGTTATITGTDVEVDEVFDYAKLEKTVDTEVAEVDSSTADEGAVYLGKATHSPQARSGLSGSVSKETTAQFEYTAFKLGKWSFKGNIKVYTQVSLSYYITKSMQEISLTLDFNGSFGVDVECKALEHEFESLSGKLGTLTFPVVPGVKVEFVPELVAEITGSVVFTFNYQSTLGFKAVHDDSGWKPYNLSKTPQSTSTLDLEAKIFIGLKLTPKLEVLEGLLAEAKVEGQFGFEFEGKTNLLNFTGSSDERHECVGCIAGSLSVKLQITPSVTFLKSEKLKYSIQLVNGKWTLFEFYACLQHEKADFGKCPDVAYKITITAEDAKGNLQSAVEVTSDTRGFLGTTNENGVLLAYLPAGKHTLSATIQGEIVTKQITVKEAASVCLSLLPQVPEIFGPFPKDSLLDEGAPLASGQCGANITWKLTTGGTLYLDGTGATGDFSGNAPWKKYRSSIKKVVVGEGITSIGLGAFAECTQLTSAVIADSVTELRPSVFNGCYRLARVEMPSNLTKIGAYAFAYCEALTEVEIPKGVTSIGDYAFQQCSMPTLYLPDSVCSIGEGAFIYCNALTNIRFSAGMTAISESGFYGCTALNWVTIPENITVIGKSAFYECTTLSTVAIPDSITDIQLDAFGKCKSLKEIYYAGSSEQWDAIQIDTCRYVYCCDYFKEATLHFNRGVLDSEGEFVHQKQYNAVFGGSYNTQVSNGVTIKTADFSGLAAGEAYVLLALVSLEEENLLSGENLLYIDQATASEDGTLSFRYVQRVKTPTSYVMVCGASNKNLADAVITIPQMQADGKAQVVKPTVTYDGKTLTEGVDYILAGTVSFTQPGTYTCYIRGIYGYAGRVSCTYQVSGTGAVLSGTVTTAGEGDTTLELISGGEVVATLTVAGKTGSYCLEQVLSGSYTLKVSKPGHAPREYSLEVDGDSILDVQLALRGDVNGDGRINVQDTAKAYAHVRGKKLLEGYELACSDVTGDGRTNVQDIAMLYAHVKGTKPLH